MAKRKSKKAASAKPAENVPPEPGGAHAELGYEKPEAGEPPAMEDRPLSTEDIELINHKLTVAMELEPRIAALDRKHTVAKKVAADIADELRMARQSQRDALDACLQIKAGTYTPPKETAPLPLGD